MVTSVFTSTLPPGDASNTASCSALAQAISGAVMKAIPITPFCHLTRMRPSLSGPYVICPTVPGPGLRIEKRDKGTRRSKDLNRLSVLALDGRRSSLNVASCGLVGGSALDFGERQLHSRPFVRIRRDDDRALRERLRRAT